MWRIIYSTVTASGTASLTMSGLNGNVDKDYRLSIIGTSTGNDKMTLSFNSDTTSGNYTTQRMYGVGAVDGADVDNTPSGILLNSANTLTFLNTVEISAATGFYRQLFSRSAITASDYIALILGTWDDNSTNITQIVLTGGVDAGMRVVLWARR